MSADTGADNPDSGSRDANATEGTPPVAEPVLRIVSENASPEDVATLTVLFAAMSGDEEPSERESAWKLLARKGRYAPRPGPGAWRLAARGR